MRREDLALSEEQLLLRRSARRFLQDNCPYAAVAELEESEQGYSPALWRQIADLGWTGLVFPEDAGGQGGNLLGLMVLCEEMGRALFPSPYFASIVLGGLSVLEAGSDAQRRRLLPSLASGEKIASLGLLEETNTYEARGVRTRAERRSRHWVLNGTKVLVDFARAADWIVCVARSAESEPPERGVGLFIVDAHAPGVEVTGLANVAGAKLGAVELRDVAVPDDEVLGAADGGWPSLQRSLAKATIAQCAQIVGACERIVDMCVQYAQERVQYGQPIGVHQAMQWKCVDMVRSIHQARVLTHMAAAALNDGEDAPLDVSMAKVAASQAARSCAYEGHQIFSGTGHLMDHHLQLYSRRLKAMELSLGDADYHLEKVAQALGL